MMYGSRSAPGTANKFAPPESFSQIIQFEIRNDERLKGDIVRAIKGKIPLFLSFLLMNKVSGLWHNRENIFFAFLSFIPSK
jgi:hypothetical protein